MFYFHLDTALSLAPPALRRGLMFISLLVTLLLPPLSAEVAAKAPPLATTVLDTAVYATPDLNGGVIGAVPLGTEVELTGDAAPGFLAVYFGDGVAWVPAQYLTTCIRPGIDTAVAIQDTPLLEAPMRDAEVILTVPEGAAVILTGATVDGYDAAAHEGAGGWINGRDISR